MIKYDGVNQVVLSSVPGDVSTVLDVGCGTGRLGGELEQRGARVTGITFNPDEAEAARAHMTRAIVADLNTFTFDGLTDFDCAICSHVLEHLYEPAAVLNRIASTVRPGGHVIVALPNIMTFQSRSKFLLGRFQYTLGGLMDSTHFRFFDRASALALLHRAALEVVSVRDDGYFPLRGLRGVVPTVAKRIDRIALRLMPNLFAWQIVMVGRVKPHRIARSTSMAPENL